jgi:hypothetical protein
MTEVRPPLQAKVKRAPKKQAKTSTQCLKRLVFEAFCDRIQIVASLAANCMRHAATGISPRAR